MFNGRNSHRNVLGLSAVLLCGSVAAAQACVVGTGSGASCTEAALDACLPGGASHDGSVTFACGDAPATIVLTGTKTISSATAIDGGGLVTIDGNDSVRLFIVNSGVIFEVANLTLSNGSASMAGGGAIASNEGVLRVVNSDFNGNSTASGLGGAINTTAGSAEIRNCRFDSNQAVAGGAIYINGTPTGIWYSEFVGNSTAPANGGGAIAALGGSLDVFGSTFHDNTAGGGSAITTSSPATIVNSTFFGNHGTSSGALLLGSTATIVNSTIVDNDVVAGAGGVANLGGSTVSLTNSIVASNGGDNCAGSITDGGHNLQFGDTTCGMGIAVADPRLSPAGLASNGGPTPTLALCTAVGTPTGCSGASPAISAGDQVVCDDVAVAGADQRGYVRPGSGAMSCSIGAFEANAVAAAASCPDSPAFGCALPGKTSIKIAIPGDPTKNAVKWKWGKGTIASAALADPTASGSYALCLYNDGALFMDSVLESGTGWSAAGSGYKYKNKAGNADGVTKALVASGTGKAKLQVAGKGSSVPVPMLPLTTMTGVTAQLVKNVAGGSECWESDFETATRNEATQYSAKAP